MKSENFGFANNTEQHSILLNQYKYEINLKHSKFPKKITIIGSASKYVAYAYYTEIRSCNINSLLFSR